MPIPSSLGEYQSLVPKPPSLSTIGKTVSTSVTSTLGKLPVVGKLFNKQSGNQTSNSTSDSSSGGAPETTTDTVPQDLKDLRVRVSLPPNAPPIFYNDENNPLMNEYLSKTGGFIFPIQPNISMSFEATYQETTLTHSNFPYQNYQNSRLSPITLTGDFPIRTAYDANYVMAGIHFLRSCTRMFTGKDGEYAGAPPIVVRLKGLGFSGFDNLPVVITNVTTTYNDGVDFISFNPFKDNLSEVARLPVVVSIQLTMNPVFSRDFISNIYSTLDYSKTTVRLLGTAPKPVSKNLGMIDSPLIPPPGATNLPPMSGKVPGLPGSQSILASAKSATGAADSGAIGAASSKVPNLNNFGVTLG